MQRLTQEQIENINSKIKDDWNQGVFKEPYGVDHEKEYVIYQRHALSGASGGSCWGDEAEYWDSPERPDWEALDLVLTEVCPDIPYLKYKQILDLELNSTDTEIEYYGNYTDYIFYWISLETLYKFLEI